MAPPGRRPTPTPILRLHGSRRADARKGEPQPELGAPDCPSWLDDEAKAAWEDIAPQLERMGVLTRIDKRALARYCDAWMRWRAAVDFIKRHGDTYPLKDESGRTKYLQQFPQVSIANKLATELLRLEQEFGMTPSARTRIQVDVQPFTDDQSKKARFFQSGA